MNDRTTQYALDVLDDFIIAGKYVKLACKRHLDDLEKSKSDDFEFYFDFGEANRIIEFAEDLVINEGDEIFKMKLYPFQCFILGNLMGWKHKKTEYRKYRSSYIQVGRQNGKSVINGILGVYLSAFDGYKNGKIICSAVDKKQARICWEEMQKFILGVKALKPFFKIVDSDSLIKCTRTGTTIRAVSRNTEGMDGFRSYFAIADELHKHRTNQMYKLLEGGQGKLKQCLLSAITTAGFDLNSFCKEHYDFCVKVLEGVVEKDSQFVFIAQMDKEDDIWDHKNWIKANPLKFTDIEGNLDDDSIKAMEDIATEARAKGGNDLVDFMTKQLNIWVEFTEKRYLNINTFKKGASDLTLEDMRGLEATLGIDLSKGGDLTSIALIFKFNCKLFIHQHSFIPELRVLEHEKTDLAPYRQWIRDGLLTTTKGYRTDYNKILEYLKEITTKYNIKIKQIGYDEHNIGNVLDDLKEMFEIEEPVAIYQTHKMMNDAVVDFKLQVDEGNVLYNKKDKLLEWTMINAEVDYNKYGECKIDKQLRRQRIDTIDAIIDAYKLMLMQKPKIDINSYFTSESWGM